MKDLTKGSLPKTILSFAIPIFFGNLFQLFYSLADTRIVGEYLGKQALASIGSSSSLTNLLISFMNGISLGFAVPIARFFGAKEPERLKKAFGSSVLMGFLLCLVLVLTGLSRLSDLLRFLQVEEALLADAKTYCAVLLSGIFFTFAYNMGAAVLRAIGDSVTPLLLLVCSSLINVGLDLYFIRSLGLGVFGAALATLIAQAVSAVLCTLYILRRYPILHFSLRDMKPECKMAKELLLSGCSMAFMSALVQLGTLILQSAINGLGEDIIVAHTAARKVTEMLMLPFSIVGAAMCTFTSQNLGAGKYDRIRKGIRGAFLFLCGWSLLAALLSYTAAAPLAALVTGTSDASILQTAALYLRFDTSFYLVPAAICLFRNCLQGLGNHLTPIVSSSIELFGKILFARLCVPLLGYWGIILTEPVVWFLMVIPLILRLLGNPYLRKGRQPEQL